MNYRTMQNSRGVALLAALFVMMVLSILGTWMLMSVNTELQLSKSEENAERALKIAEAGVQVARSTFFKPFVIKNLNTQSLASIDGFYRGGYFMAQLRAGFQGNEKWTQWRYDASASATNRASQITAPVFPIWQSYTTGVNGSWQGTSFSVAPLYGVVARGVYFPVQTASGDTLVRAHDEQTGDKRVVRDDSAFPVLYYWKYDKSLKDTVRTPNVQFAAGMSPLASFSNYTTKIAGADPVLSQQTLYFAYAGNKTSLTTTDTTSTIRLRAVNALCHGTSPYDTAGARMDTLWEFDTGLHGVATAPAIFDPDLGMIGSNTNITTPPGDKIIYFAVLTKGTAGSATALNLNSTGLEYFWQWPSKLTDGAEQIYIFAVVDTSGKPAPDCSSTGSYRLKWAKPFPDPDVADWTDYPTEHLTGTEGQDPPYLKVPADLSGPPLPEEDLLPDYRDTPGNTNNAYDGQWNQVRGQVVKSPPNTSVSPVVLNVLYRKSDGTLTESRSEASTDNSKPGSRFDPLIDIYLMYSVNQRVLVRYNFQNGYSLQSAYDKLDYPTGAASWGVPGYRHMNQSQIRVLALRDRLARNGNAWNWNAAKSRYPKYKWNYLMPSWDPDATAAAPDARPGNGYGEYNWDNWFYGNIAPMVNNLTTDQTLTIWADVKDAQSTPNAVPQRQNLYPVIYPYGEAQGYFQYWGFDNVPESAGSNVVARGPTVAEGSPKDFSTTSWTDSHALLMAARDTWDDYMNGARTNILGVNLDQLNLGLSNPVEHYWTHRDGSGIGGAGALAYVSTSDDLTYETTINAPYRTNTDKVNWPRPYSFWELLWVHKVKDNLRTGAWGDFKSPSGYNATAPYTSGDIDVVKTTAALCKDCLNRQGLLVWSYIQNVWKTGATGTAPNDYSAPTAGSNFSSDNDAEDTRWDAVNATTGKFVWNYHAPSSLRGYDDTNSPAIAHNVVFATYQQWGSKGIQANRVSHMVMFSADDGRELQNLPVDRNSDGIIMSPSIANGAVYVGTYDANINTRGSGTRTDDVIRIFAMSPILRLVSTGIYPFSYANYTSKSFQNITLLDHDTIFKNPTGGEKNRGAYGAWVRRIQVWVTGQNSKWEEVRDILKPN